MLGERGPVTGGGGEGRGSLRKGKAGGVGEHVASFLSFMECIRAQVHLPARTAIWRLSALEADRAAARRPRRPGAVSASLWPTCVRVSVSGGESTQEEKQREYWGTSTIRSTLRRRLLGGRYLNTRSKQHSWIVPGPKAHRLGWDWARMDRRRGL